MALVYEKVKKEDWELYNSFLPNIETADEYTKWVVDREKNIYFFWTGGEVRESIYEFFMSLDNLKVYIYTQIRCVAGNMYVWIDRISIPKKISDNNEKKAEIVSLVKEILQILYNNKIVFQSVEEPIARKGDN